LLKLSLLVGACVVVVVEVCDALVVLLWLNLLQQLKSFLKILVVLQLVLKLVLKLILVVAVVVLNVKMDTLRPLCKVPFRKIHKLSMMDHSDCEFD